MAQDSDADELRPAGFEWASRSGRARHVVVGVELPVKLVRPSRAEPIAALYVAGKASHAGAFPELEDEMCALTVGGAYHGPGRSPDRADALVWALTELMLGKTRTMPRAWVG